MKIGIIVAMDKELVQLRQTLSDEREIHISNGQCYYSGRIGEKDIILQKCGIGKVNAAVGASMLIEHTHPDIVVSTGCAGGADTSLQVTEIVVGSSYTYHDVYCGTEVEYGQFVGMPATYQADPHLLDVAKHLECSTRVHSGLMVSGDWFVDSREKMRDILDHFPNAMAVDMESCAIAQTCHLLGLPFISFRIISDVPLSDHKASQYFDFWSNMANGSFEVTRTFIESL